MARHFDGFACGQEFLIYGVKLLVAKQLRRPGTITRIGRKWSTAGINAFGEVGLRLLVGALSEDHACLCLPGQSFHEPSLPPVLCIEHAETSYCDSAIILVVGIERLFSACVVASWVVGFRPCSGGDVRLNRIVQQISKLKMFSKYLKLSLTRAQAF